MHTGKAERDDRSRGHRRQGDRVPRTRCASHVASASAGVSRASSCHVASLASARMQVQAFCVAAESRPQNGLGRSPGSEGANHPDSPAASPSPAAWPSGFSKQRAFTYSGGTAPDLHRTSLLCPNGHPSRGRMLAHRTDQATLLAFGRVTWTSARADSFAKIGGRVAGVRTRWGKSGFGTLASTERAGGRARSAMLFLSRVGRPRAPRAVQASVSVPPSAYRP